MFETLKNIACTDRLLRRVPGIYQHARRQLHQFEATGAAERTKLQRERISATLRRASALPGYDQVSASEWLEDWSILTKSDIQGREQLFADASLYPAPRAESGGTTGMPLRLKRSIPSITFEQAVVDSLAERIGIDVRKARIAMLKADNLDPSLTGNGQYWFDIGSKKRVYSSHHICADTAEAYRQSLVDFAPDILFCYPSSVETLLHYLGSNHDLKIPLVFTSSEILYPATLGLIRNQLHSDSIDFYGHAERLVSAYNINGGPYRFLPSYGHAELVPCGEGMARIIATTLRKTGQVFVRYDTCDIARVPSHDPKVLEKISLGLLPFDGIVGRDSEFVDLPDGRRITMVNMVARGADGANSLQFKYDGRYLIDIYLVPGANFGPATIQRVLENFYKKFPPEMQVKVWKVPARVREQNGKAPLLLREPALTEDMTLIECPANSNQLQARPSAAA